MNNAKRIEEIKRQHRKRETLIRMRIQQENGLRASVASALGYHSDLGEKKRLALFRQAEALIKKVRAGEERHEREDIIRWASIGIDALKDGENFLDKELLGLVVKLPVAAWVQEPEQRGFGLPSLYKVVGEAGDLAGYSGPFKLYKRLGLMPRTFDGKTHMGSTWRKNWTERCPPRSGTISAIRRAAAPYPTSSART